MRKNIRWRIPDTEDYSGSPSKHKKDVNLLESARKLNKNIKISKTNVFTEYFKEFVSNTSLHGFKYLGENKRSAAERIWWGIMLALSVAACSHLILKVWNKWHASPVIVSFAESSTPVWQVPFPAITICSETKSRQKMGFNFTEFYHRNSASLNMTDEERYYFESIALVCDKHLVKQGNKTTDKSVMDVLNKVAPEIDEMLYLCKWNNTATVCSDLFSKIVTEDGICYSFNMLNSDELFRKEMIHDEYSYLDHNKSSEGWSLDDGYPKGSPLYTYPARGTGAGITAGLTVLLRLYNYDLDYLCKGPVQGFKIALHGPSEMPKVATQYFRVPLAQEVIAAIKPNMMTTSEGLKSYDPQGRQCFFTSERKLKFFNVYSQNNCEHECLANYTHLMCDCVSFSMPRDPSWAICASGSTQCVEDATANLLTQEMQKGLDSSNNVKDGKLFKKKNEMERIAEQCNCLPACTSISYDAEISQADFNWKNLFSAFKANFSEIGDAGMSRVVLFFKESQFIPSRRSELYGQTDFLANCGGLLGLCLGFSVLSLVEIIYFVTLRAFCNLKNRVQRRKGPSHNNLSTMDAGINFKDPSS